jgi:hypothetical protein
VGDLAAGGAELAASPGADGPLARAQRPHHNGRARASSRASSPRDGRGSPHAGRPSRCVVDRPAPAPVAGPSLPQTSALTAPG